MIHAAIPEKYKKYPSTTIPTHVNVLAKLHKLPHVRLLNMMPHDDYSITIHIHTMTMSNIRHKQNE